MFDWIFSRKQQPKTTEKPSGPQGITFIRQGYPSGGEISITYKWDGWEHAGPMGAAELGYFMGDILRWYRIDDAVLVNKITEAFFRHFPEEKKSCYPALSFTVDSGNGFEEKLHKIDVLVRGFLDEVRALCKEHPRNRSKAWLKAERV